MEILLFVTFFQFYVDVNYTNIKLNTEILIGTIPLQGTFYSYQPPLAGPQPVITQQPSAPLLGDFEQPLQPYGQTCPSEYYARMLQFEIFLL